MVGKYSAAVAANRFGLGARPGEIGAMSDDPRGALRAQLLGGAPLLHNAALQDTATVLTRAAELRAERRDDRRAQARDKSSTADPAAAGSAVVPEAAQKLQAMFRGVYIDDAGARMRQAVRTDRPFVERLVHFWTNHFAVSVDKGVVLGVAGAFEREAIRPHVLDSFHDMLLAVEQHPAMLLYLDNFQSVGPNSKAARARERRPSFGAAPKAKVGINENLAREILELHTLGVGSGYTQTDVTEFAKVITGWSIGGGEGRQRAGSPGVFYYRDAVHEPGTRTLLGNSYSDDGFSQGVAVLRDLARAPATAHHIATKLARHFIADDPPAAAVDRLA